MSSIPDRRTIHAYAGTQPGLIVQPFKYESRPLGAEDVEIGISHCGICGSDVHALNDRWHHAKFPLVAGHEIVGHVTAMGTSVTSLAVGDRVGVGAQIGACLDPATCDGCAAGREPNCSRMMTTYNGVYPDGTNSYGGFSQFVRVWSAFTFKIPDEIPSEMAAPLLCAGTTVYTPLKEHIQSGFRVGVVGIGGLGHVALQFIRALDAVPVAFSHSPNKEEQARQLGAHEFVNMQDPEAVRGAARSVNLLLVTADSKGQPFDTYLSLLRVNGKLILVGLPEDAMSFSPMSLLLGSLSVVGSAVGSRKDVREMLALAAKKNVRPVIQKLPMKEINKGLEMVGNGSVRYRVVLEN